MKSTFLLVLFILINNRQYLCLQENYYWREYTGDIPKDAVVGGQDINRKNVYIGQVYVKNGGLIVSQIYPGSKEVFVPINGIKEINSNIKILCGPQQNFYWAPVNSTHLHLFLIDQHAVIGGHEDEYGKINIGRISYEGEIKIGKVNSFNIENSLFFFNKNQKEQFVKSYEILLYKENDIDVRAKTINDPSANK